MPRDLFAEQKADARDLFDENGINPNQQSTQPKMSKEEFLQQFNRTPLDNVRDVAAGAISGLGKGGQLLGSALTGGYAPQFDFDKLVQPIASQHPSSTLQGIGSVLPYGAAIGAGILPQMGAGAFRGVAENRDHPVLGGMLGGLEGLGAGLLPNALNTLGKSVSGIKNLFSKATFEDVGKAIQNNHDYLDQKASDIFNKVTKEAYEREIDRVPIDNNLIKQARDLLPKTRSVNALLENAETGDYNSLRDLQTELFHKGNKRLKSQLPSDNDTGEIMHDLRDRINESITNHLNDTGNEDLSALLDLGKEQYKYLKNTYFKEPMISDLVGSEKRKITPSLVNKMNEISKPMDRIREANPEALKLVNMITSKEDTINNLKKLGLYGGAFGGLGYGINWLRNHLFP